MRRAALALALTCAAAAAVPALAADSAVVVGPQAEKGTITAPIPPNVTGGPRRAALASTGTNGLIGWYFDVDPSTVGGTFDLAKTADPTGQGDLDVLFYSNPGDLGQGAPTAVGTFATALVGGEKGLVPEGAKTALVYLQGGARVGFDYKAAPATVLSLSASTLSATVAKDAALRFFNDTPGALTVTATDLDESDAPLFDTGEIAPGSGASVQLATPGTYGFSVGGRTGTITVTG